MKTNKSFTKRLKITKNGKILGRKSGQDHFNAKESRNTQLKKKKAMTLHFTSRNKARFLPGRFR